MVTGDHNLRTPKYHMIAGRKEIIDLVPDKEDTLWKIPDKTLRSYNSIFDSTLGNPGEGPEGNQQQNEHEKQQLKKLYNHHEIKIEFNSSLGFRGEGSYLLKDIDDLREEKLENNEYQSERIIFSDSDKEEIQENQEIEGEENDKAMSKIITMTNLQYILASAIFWISTAQYCRSDNSRTIWKDKYRSRLAPTPEAMFQYITDIATNIIQKKEIPRPIWQMMKTTPIINESIMNKNILSVDQG